MNPKKNNASAPENRAKDKKRDLRTEYRLLAHLHGIAPLQLWLSVNQTAEVRAFVQQKGWRVHSPRSALDAMSVKNPKVLPRHVIKPKGKVAKPRIAPLKKQAANM